MFGELEFYAAFDAVLGELAEEIAWRYEGGDIIAVGPSIKNLELGVAQLEEVGYQPSAAAVDLISRYRRQQN